MTLKYQRFTSVLLLYYGIHFLCGIYYCLRVFWCAAARMPQLELEQRKNIKFLVKLGKSRNEIREILVQVYGDNDRLCGLVVRVSGYRYRGLGFDSRRYQIF